MKFYHDCMNETWLCQKNWIFHDTRFVSENILTLFFRNKNFNFVKKKFHRISPPLEYSMLIQGKYFTKYGKLMTNLLLCEFYQSITENILQQTLKLSKEQTNIDKNDLCIINHCRKSLLFYEWFLLMHNFNQLSLNSGSAQVQTLPAACRIFAMVRISDNGPGWK